MIGIYMCAPEKINLNDVCQKMKKMMVNDELDAQKGAELNFCRRQYLYISE